MTGRLPALVSLLVATMAVIACVLARAWATGAPDWAGAEAAASWLRGDIPWWDALAGLGAPTGAARPSVAFLMPGALLMGSPAGSLVLAAALRVAALAGAWALLRSLRLPLPARTAGAALFALGMPDAALPAGTFLPLLLLGVERLSSGRPGGATCLVAGFVGTIAACGATTTAWMAVLLASVWAATRLFEAEAGAGATRLGRLIGAAAVAVLVAAPLLWLGWQLPAGEVSHLERIPPMPWIAAAGLAVALLSGRSDRPLGWALGLWLALGLGKTLDVPAVGFVMDVATSPRAPLSPAAFAQAASPGWWLAAATLAGLATTGLATTGLATTGLATTGLSTTGQAATRGRIRAALAVGCVAVAIVATEGPARIDAATRNAVLDGLGFGRVLILAPRLARSRDLPGVATLGPDDALAGADLLTLARHGVARIVTAAGTRPMDAPVTLDPPLAADAQAWELAAGQSVTGVFPAEAVRAGTVERTGIEIGTYGGASTGALDVALCRGAVCVSGQVPLAGAADNRVLFARLDRPLPVAAGDVLRWRVTHVGPPDAHAVALWLHPDPATGTDGPVPERIARVALAVRTQAIEAALLHGGPRLEVRAVPDPSPYFAITGGPCRLAPSSRTALQAECDGAARLTRLERFLPGWRVDRNGRPAGLARDGDGFQLVDLPAGASALRFAYAPPGRLRVAVLAVIGLLLWAIILVRDHRRREPA